MIKQYIKYGGVAAKIKVMYGRRLKKADYDILLSRPSVQEIAIYLKNQTIYEEILSGVDEQQLHRGQIEALLKKSVMQSYVKLSHFLSMDDKKVLEVIAKKQEIEQLLYIIRSIQTKSTESSVDIIANIDSLAIKNITDDLQKLSKCETFESLVNQLKNTQYAAVLQPYTGEFYNYSHVENALLKYYYTCAIKTIKKIYGKLNAKKLVDNIGIEVDIVNIIRIMRLKKFFPNVKIQDYLFEFGKKLGDEQLDMLMKSDDVIEMLKTIIPSYYERFKHINFDNLDDFEDEMLFKIYKNILNKEQASIIIVVAYLNLKDIEVHNLIHIIEGIRYGIPISDIMVRMTGYEN